MAARTFLGTLRLAILIAVLLFVALGAWLDRARSRDWDNTLRVTVYPASHSTDPGVRAYTAALQAEDFAMRYRDPLAMRLRTNSRAPLSDANAACSSPACIRWKSPAQTRRSPK